VGSFIFNGFGVANSSNSTRITAPSHSKDLTSEQSVTIKIRPGEGQGEAALSPKNIKVNAGTTVVWQNLVEDKVFLQSEADSEHLKGQAINAPYIYPGETYEQKMDQTVHIFWT
jgi:hypothetical protein